MASVASSPPPIRSRSGISRLFSYLFDIRFLGVIGQLVFIALMVYGAIAIGTNFAGNAEKLGDAQFRCTDGSFSYRCAYDFMQGNAGFDISDTPLNYSTTDSFWWAFMNGVVNTFRVGILALVATTILGTLMGIARLSENWLVSNIALAYIEIIRNTPILVQLLLIYFSVVLAMPSIDDAIQLPGSIFLSNRGLSMPWPRLMESGPIWVGFLIAGIVLFGIIWNVLGRRQEQTGKPNNRLLYGFLAFLAAAVIGWFVASAGADYERLLVSSDSGITSVDDIEAFVLARSGVDNLSDPEALTEEQLEAATVQVCTLRNSSSESNLTNRLATRNIPFNVRRGSSPERTINSFTDGRCDVVAMPEASMNEGLAEAEASGIGTIIPIAESPITLSTPRREGFNLNGGWSMTGEFFALFLGLTIFYGGGLAEVVRAGILSVSKGQTEAARALGLQEGQRLQLIVLPQALKVIIPPLISTYLSLMKDTSLGVAIAFPEMYFIAQVTMNQSGRALQIMILIMVVYLAISIFFSLLLNWYNKRITLVER